jgi:hypothetical protein
MAKNLNLAVQVFLSREREDGEAMGSVENCQCNERYCFSLTLGNVGIIDCCGVELPGFSRA